MKWKNISDNWLNWKTQIQRQWPKLSNEEIMSIAGNRLRLADIISQEYSLSEEQAEREIDTWLSAQ